MVVIPGDAPLLRSETLLPLIEAHQASGAAVTVLTAEPIDPTGSPRVVRGKAGRVTHIVEQPDATVEELAIGEVATGVYAFRRSLLGPALRRVTPRNVRGVRYLSDVVRVLAETGHPVATQLVGDATDTLEVNDRVQLARVEAELRRRTNAHWLERGVTLVDPARTYIDTTVSIGADVTIFPGTMLQGRTVVGAGADVGPNTRLVDCAIGAGARVQETVGHDAEVGPGAVVGPYAVLDPGGEVAPGARTGAFFRAVTRET